MIPTEADHIENLKFQELDGQQLDELLSGCVIIGAEPIDYPLTDGMLLYFQDAQKRKFAIELNAQEGDESINGLLQILVARLQQ